MNKCKKCNKTLNIKNRKFCSIKCSNQFNQNNKKNIKIKIGYSKELAELFGILIGDGSVTKYYTRIYLSAKADKGYSKNILKLVNKVFPLTRVAIKYRKDRGTEELQISSKDISDYFFKLGFKPKARKIPNWIKNNEEFSKSSLRGLFDTEGSISIKKFKGKNKISTYKQLTFTNKNKEIIKFVKITLRKLKLSNSETNGYNVYISNKQNIAKYFQEIGTKNPKLEKKYKMK
ncbi:MAG: hypothetical protein KBD14_00470 [Candidatus Pacebacteria bacterium]|nr:hypothetical protein [Candidatus Paceibacterota bacterium]